MLKIRKREMGKIDGMISGQGSHSYLLIAKRIRFLMMLAIPRGENDVVNRMIVAGGVMESQYESEPAEF